MRGREPIMRPPREVDPKVDKVIEQAKILNLRVALGNVKRDEKNSAQIDKVEITLDVLRDRGFASPQEILGLNADLAALGMLNKLEVN